MSSFTDPRVLRRFIILLAILTFVMFSIWAFLEMYHQTLPGDYETREGDIKLSDGHYGEAIARFDAALRAQPDHRGALHGKAAALIALERYDEAEVVLTYLIDFLTRTLEADDKTGRGALSAAYANRGIIKDRQARYEEALADYVEAAKVDYDLAEGPDWIDRLLYHDREPSSVIKRAQYLHEQLKLPPEQRRLRLPERDAQQRMYKP